MDQDEEDKEPNHYNTVDGYYRYVHPRLTEGTIWHNSSFTILPRRESVLNHFLGLHKNIRLQGTVYSVVNVDELCCSNVYFGM